MSAGTTRDYLKPVGFRPRDFDPGEPVDISFVSPETFYGSKMYGFSDSSKAPQTSAKPDQPRKCSYAEELEISMDDQETQARTVLPWILGLDPTIAPYRFLLEKITARRGQPGF